MANRSPQLFADGYVSAAGDVPLRLIHAFSGVGSVTSGDPDSPSGLMAALRESRPITVTRRHDRVVLATPPKVVEALASQGAPAEQPDGVTE
ncbi:hypothetical protein [Streptomyces palmae]|uniref:Uncharacterized protein n=1 Tax=Streptomyces palmae TaxID=1701085 RepID=A0A4Z0HD27_9ACTN|nr:hypothetical protein [Streptomyces palmae]TGB10014.1 hypothetical protein E4099_13105 [Streptomyces palmae]